MGGPAWLTGIFAALMLTVAVYCAGRLITARWWHRPTEPDTDGAHVVMGVAMAGMLETGLRTPWRCLHPAPHLVECVAMLFMFLVLPTTAAVKSTMAAMTASATESRFSFLALALALYMFGYVVWVGDRLTVRTPALALAGAQATGSGPAGCTSTPPTRPYLAPRCAALCKIAMGVTMGYMLILML